MMQVFAFKTVINHFTFSVDKLRHRRRAVTYLHFLFQAHSVN